MPACCIFWKRLLQKLVCCISINIISKYYHIGYLIHLSIISVITRYWIIFSRIKIFVLSAIGMQNDFLAFISGGLFLRGLDFEQHRAARVQTQSHIGAQFTIFCDFNFKTCDRRNYQIQIGL